MQRTETNTELSEDTKNDFSNENDGNGNNDENDHYAHSHVTDSVTPRTDATSVNEHARMRPVTGKKHIRIIDDSCHRNLAQSPKYAEKASYIRCMELLRNQIFVSFFFLDVTQQNMLYYLFLSLTYFKKRE